MTQLSALEKLKAEPTPNLLIVELAKKKVVRP
jgi:hypothetical protein